MAVILLLSGCWTLLFLSLSPSAATELINITAESGQNVSLSCRAQNRNPVTFVEWSKYGLKRGYLLLYRDERFAPENQHPSFKKRVELQDRQMKDGHLSVILKDVTFNDTGTYECHVFMGQTRSWKLISSITLRVAPPPGPGGGFREDGGKEDGGASGLITGLVVAAVLLVAVVGFVIYRNHVKQQSSQWPYAR